MITIFSTLPIFVGVHLPFSVTVSMCFCMPSLFWIPRKNWWSEMLPIICAWSGNYQFADTKISMAIHASVTFRNDCHSLPYMDKPSQHMQKLWLMQNTAGCFFARASQMEHITAIPWGLPWLLSCFQVQLKMLILISNLVQNHVSTCALSS